MSAALRLVDLNAPTMSPASLARSASMRPTLVPGSRTTVFPTLTGSFATEPPMTQRSATVHPRFEEVARADANNMLAVLRMNVDFLTSLLDESSAPSALAALDDIHACIDRLERRFGPGTFNR